VTQPEYIPYATAVPASRDADHLRVLSILHYVWGGLVMLISCFALIYVVVGLMMATNRLPGMTAGPTSAPAAQPPPAVIGSIVAGMGGCGLIGGWGLGIATILSGRRMMQRRSRVFSIVMASISCLSVPLGTTLGVFTIVILMRDSVKALYAASGVTGPATSLEPPRRF
jgi:hypothetical protein